LVSRVSPALLGTAVGGVIVLTNSQKLVKYFDITSPWSTLIYAGIVIAWGTFVYLAWKISKAPTFVPAELENEVADDAARPAEAADDAR
jgi:hypothetical protein